MMEIIIEFIEKELLLADPDGANMAAASWIKLLRVMHEKRSPVIKRS
jgi:hypothetical protein